MNIPESPRRGAAPRPSEKTEAAAFSDVFAAELEEISVRQNTPNADPKELAGLALSGGGIRSATTSLGVLQALKKLGMIDVFDYLSTVSGGGFAGSWWSAWTSRDFDDTATAKDMFFPPDERTQPERDALSRETASPSQNAATLLSTGPSKAVASRVPDAAQLRKAADPVHHLRLFSNYLTPSKGMASGDTWRAVTVISRNLVLTWFILVPLLFAAVLLAQAYFVTQPNSEKEFLYPYSHESEDRNLNLELQKEMATVQSLDHIIHHDTTKESIYGISIGAQQALPMGAIIPESAQIGTMVHRDIDTIMANEQMDSIAAGDAGQPRIFSAIDQEFTAIQNISDKEVLGTIPIINRPALDRSLDLEVDSVKENLAAIQEAMVEHRWELRDSWLFNAEHKTYLTNRLLYASYIPIAFLAWIVMFVVLWMLNVNNMTIGGSVLQGTFAFFAGMVAFTGMLCGLPLLLGREIGFSVHGVVYSSLAWQFVALVLLHRVIWDDAHAFWKANHKRNIAEIRNEVLCLLEERRARIVTAHERLMLALFFSTVFLLFGGFGHELVNYLFNYSSDQLAAESGQWLARLASVATIVSAIVGTLLMARSALPSSGSDRRDSGQPPKWKSTLIALAPPLVLLVLLCNISWLGHYVLQHVVFRADMVSDQHFLILVLGTLVFGATSLYYAGDELVFAKARRFKREILFLSCLVISVVTWAFLRSMPFSMTFAWMAVGLNALAWLMVIAQSRRDKSRPGPAEALQGPVADGRTISPDRTRRRFLAVLGASLVILLGSQAILVSTGFILSELKMPFHWPYFAGLIGCLIMLVYDLIWGAKGNHEARVLIGLVAVMLTSFLFIPTIFEDAHWGVLHVLATLVSVSIGLVIFIGWRIDPNALSIHAFYQQRLVRAYLGASNWIRARGAGTDVHRNDDLPLTSLQNTEHGAPYHIVNTTLNLLGSKSLELAQRHSSNFIMTKRYCGSVTTGYRNTKDYMAGEMTLGTAVAISGAAASPNMGSNAVSGATTMLMSLLNVRLGYWAANPGRARWREAQPRLWPYYLLMETLSKTTGLGAFCYLTDGGHFDNTGMYPLIERVCRTIVICDNGADPASHFKDIGNAFRRCRIDFGAEFELDDLKDMTVLGNSARRKHWLTGTVTYSEPHLRSVWGADWDKGMTAEEKLHYQTGTLLILKPMVLGDEPADVLQYGLENPDFPQQSTANQWFSENQFESYRRLGLWTAESAFEFGDYSTATRAEKLAALTILPRANGPEENHTMNGVSNGIPFGRNFGGANAAAGRTAPLHPFAPDMQAGAVEMPNL